MPLGYSAEDHSGYLGAQLTKVTGGVQEYFSTPFTYEGGEVKAYEGERPAVVNNGIPE